ncbi:hypothetical protein [Psychromonas sp. SR45-3]|uniref:hypothetical protein n=1 Tax=Psychromonas sp. SR45-3 TaxID=2760930 RepID=UPI0015F79CC7|nr:hypothetical protein [Psychromonas sp. SR45-3]MBB1271716.1 hypothetical protein [Psychromonas sp. SR45-3]
MHTTIMSSIPSPFMSNVESGQSTEETSASKTLEGTEKSPTSVEIKATTKEDSVSFSNRAMKIQSITKDFFSGGQLLLADIPQYIKRLESDGFLTAAEVDKLSHNDEKTTDQLSDKTTKVLDWIDSFRDKVNQKDPQDGLVDVLNQVEKHIENLSSNYNSSMTTDVKKSLLELDNYLKSDNMMQWEKQDIEALKDVKTILSLANQLHFNKTNSTAINKYLQFSGKSYG